MVSGRSDTSTFIIDALLFQVHVSVNTIMFLVDENGIFLTSFLSRPLYRYVVHTIQLWRYFGVYQSKSNV